MYSIFSSNVKMYSNYKKFTHTLSKISPNIINGIVNPLWVTLT